MKRFHLLGAAVFVVVLALNMSSGAIGDADALHAYRLDFRGTAGVKLRLLLVTKGKSNANPERREEVVTLPAQINFKAIRCYAWIDTLPDGKSGDDGDVSNVDLLKDGRLSSTLERTINRQAKQSSGFGDL